MLRDNEVPFFSATEIRCHPEFETRGLRWFAVRPDAAVKVMELQRRGAGLSFGLWSEYAGCL